MAPSLVLYGSILSLVALSGNVNNSFLGDFIDLSWSKVYESIFTEFASNFSMEAPR
jgi:hypothetical protein